MSLFNTFIEQHASAYLVVIRCIKTVGEIAALLCELHKRRQGTDTVRQDATIQQYCFTAAKNSTLFQHLC
jgi:hypothetical protein